MYARPSADEISHRLSLQISDVVRDLYPSALMRGAVAYCAPKSKTDSGSFQVYLKRHLSYDQGRWHRWSQGIGGGPIQLAAYRLTGHHTGDHAYKEAFRWSYRFLGIEDRPETPAEKQAREKRDAQIEKEAKEARQRNEADFARQQAGKVATASEIWRASSSLVSERGSKILRYMRTRGISEELDASPELRAHEAVFNSEALRFYPALVALVRSVDAKPQAIWRIYLNEDGTDKAPVKYPKLGLGPAGGGAVRLGGIASSIGIAEGVETALACAAIDSWKKPVWAGLSTSGLIGFECPPEVTDVTVYADHDDWSYRNSQYINPGLNAAYKLSNRLLAEGKRSRVIAPPPGMDFLDLWRETKELAA